MGDTDDTSIYRDTKISRYWYRVCFDTFWYRDTKSTIPKVSRYFRDTFVLHYTSKFCISGLVQTISLIKF